MSTPWTPKDPRDVTFCRKTLASLMNCREPEKISTAAALFRGDLCGEPQQIDLMLQALGELAREGVTVAQHGPDPLIERLTCDSGDRETWGTIVEEIRGLKGIGADPGWWVRNAYDATLKYRLMKAGEAAGNGMKPGEVRRLLEDLYRDAAAFDGGGDATEPLHGLDLAAEPPSVPDPLVGNEKAQLIMPGEAVIIASDPGVGKTKLLTAIALGVVSGKEILG